MKKGIQLIDCWLRLSADLPGDEVVVPPNQTYKLVLDDPMGRRRIQSGKKGMGAISLLRGIKKAYEEHGVADDKMAGMTIEGIQIDHDKKTITPIIGS